MTTIFETFISSLSKTESNKVLAKFNNSTIDCKTLSKWLYENHRLIITSRSLTEQRRKNNVVAFDTRNNPNTGVNVPVIDLFLQKANSVNKQKLEELLNNSDVSSREIQKFLEQRNVEISTTAISFYRRKQQPSIQKEALQEAAPQSTLQLSKKWQPGTYVVTSAQNNTPVNLPFYDCIMNYCEQENAQLIVLPIRYKNVSAMYTGSPEWDTLLTDYYLNDNVDIAPSFTLKGSSRIAATASDPLSGWNTLGKESAVYGHGQFGLKTIASPKGQVAPQIFSTGSITDPNFANTKSSEIAEFNHSLGALILTVYDDGKVDYQWVSFKKNGFYCLNGFYTKDAVDPVKVDDVVLGDWHGFEAPKQHKDDAFMFVETLKPKRVWLHDAISFMSESHHLTNIDKARLKLPSIRDEFVQLSNEVERFEQTCKVMFVDSNHHRHVDRWLNSGTINNKDNLLLYHMLWVAVLENPSKSPFECVVNMLTDSWVSYVGAEGFLSHGIELGLHGDNGANGARGSVRGFSMLSNKSITGHGHTPEWFKGAMRVGTTGPVDPGYVRGYSGMSLCHAVVYADGSRTLVSRVQAQKLGK